MPILAVQTPAVQCQAFSWCAAHVPTDDGLPIHISPEQGVTGTYGPECSPMYVSIEQTVVPVIRLDGSGPMTPLQAMQLAGILQAAALTVLVEQGGAV